MKKYLIALVLVSLFAVAPVHAQTTNAQNQSTLQTTLNALKAQLNQLYSQLPAAAVLSATVKTIEPARTISPQTATGTCGQTLTPVGTLNQTIRCNGINWVAAGNLLNNGDIVGIGVGVIPLGGYKLGVINNLQGGVAVSVEDASGNGTGVLSYSGSAGVGVLGKTPGGGTGVWGTVSEVNAASGIAVKASNNGFGYGFYQEGANAKNYFQGKVEIGIIGTSTPPAKLNVRTSINSIPAIQANGGIRITDSGFAQPQCTNELRGTFWFQNGGQAYDKLLVCTKDVGGPIGWRVVVMN